MSPLPGHTPFPRLLAVLALHTLLHLPICSAAEVPLARDVSLNGEWDLGIRQVYTSSALVPGLPQDPASVSPDTLWYRRTVVLPGGDWNQATLILNGARFEPQVFVNGELICSRQGGMAPTLYLLRGDVVAPGRTITLEIALHSLKDTDPLDASVVPNADRWRTNISSGLWDDVTLHLSGKRRLTHITPWTDLPEHRLALHWTADVVFAGGAIRTQIIDTSGVVLVETTSPAENGTGVAELALPRTLVMWTPEHPQLYRLRVSLVHGEQVQDSSETTWALKQFESRDRHLYLNGQQVQLRGGTVVWHRFLRNPGAADIAFNTLWFKENITDRLKSYGANTLRFHLGLPPERLLDLCDREGLMVQLEWPFFHGISASIASMKEQWSSWLDVAMRHPCVMIVHAWNETEDPAGLRAGREALDSLLPHYPPLVVAHRDTVHIHKYWWSLFENLGLYYDRAEQFEQTAVVDEFGGNYLDFHGDAGLYPTTRESFLRFLGREQTREQRLAFQAAANARVAEYWRRLGVAGVLPFCALGSPQDGNSWFLGSLEHPEPMPVWGALAAAFSPLSVSLDVWDRNYTPGQQIVVPLHFFNDTEKPATLSVNLRIIDGSTGEIFNHREISRDLPALAHEQQTVELTLPSREGAWRLEAVLNNPPTAVTHPVVSSWEIRTLALQAPSSLRTARIGVSEDEHELRLFLQQNDLVAVTLADPSAQLLIGSAATWKALKTSAELGKTLATALHRGASVALLDIGPQDLGEGYRAQALGTLDAAPRLQEPYEEHTTLFDGIRVMFRQQAEPESHFHPAPEDRDLWQRLPLSATWLWNGLRGGLTVPAADMEVSGLSQEALLTQWNEYGADAKALASGEPYYAYRLAGYYAFSNRSADRPTQDALRSRVRLLAEDAPALRDVVNPNAPIDETDLAAAYRTAAEGQARHLLPLSSCGKNLTRTPIVQLTFGAQRGQLVLSQILTAGRLARGAAEPGFYGIRYDPAAEQFALNLLAKALTPPKANR